MNEILFMIVLFLSNVLQTITGFAGTVLAMPPSMILLGMNDAKVVLNAMALISGLIIAIQNYKQINIKELAKMSVFMLIGMFLGINIYNILPSDILLVVYGIIVILIGVKNLIFKKKLKLNQVFLIISLLIAGIIHGMFVSGGALLVIYAVSVLKNKDEFRATVAPVWVILNSVMMASYYADGLINISNLCLILAGFLPLILAIYLGNILQKKTDQKVFLKLTYILLIISGASVLI